jgi:hypothetical protein
MSGKNPKKAGLIPEALQLALKLELKAPDGALISSGA